MIGMIQIIIYLLCVYLIFKGVEIFQIAFMSSKTNKTAGIVIGFIMLILSIVVALSFIYWSDTFAISLSHNIQSPIDSYIESQSILEEPLTVEEPPTVYTEPKLTITNVWGQWTEEDLNSWKFSW